MVLYVACLVDPRIIMWVMKQRKLSEMRVWFLLTM